MTYDQVIDLITAIIGAGGIVFIWYLYTSIDTYANNPDSIDEDADDLQEDIRKYDRMDRMAEYESINAPEEPYILDVENLAEDDNQ